MTRDKSAWAPVPLRLAIGIALMYHGGIKLFASGGHANIAYLVGQLGVPQADLMGWIIGVVEFVGGLGMVLGLFTRVAAGINVLNVGSLIALGAMRGGIPQPLPGGDPFPAFREAFLIVAAVLSMVLSGGGRWSLDERRRSGSA
jgi:putative oxidoreductase